MQENNKHMGANTHMINFKLDVLGPLQIATPDSQIKLPRHKLRALLSYLMVEPQEHDRSNIAEMFWPDKARLSLKGGPLQHC